MACCAAPPVAAISPQFVPGRPAAWLTYVTVADADAVAGTVVEHGGAIGMVPFDVLPRVGWR